jgi:hypothetical protein
LKLIGISLKLREAIGKGQRAFGYWLLAIGLWLTAAFSLHPMKKIGLD